VPDANETYYRCSRRSRALNGFVVSTGKLIAPFTTGRARVVIYCLTLSGVTFPRARALSSPVSAEEIQIPACNRCAARLFLVRAIAVNFLHYCPASRKRAVIDRRCSSRSIVRSSLRTSRRCVRIACDISKRPRAISCYGAKSSIKMRNDVKGLKRTRFIVRK